MMVALPVTLLTRWQRRYCIKRGLLPPMTKWEIAQAGEAGTAETVKQGSVHEHAVGVSRCAQNKSA
jgi:hypothetical protein